MNAAKRVCSDLPRCPAITRGQCCPACAAGAALDPRAFLNSCTTALGGFLVTTSLDMYHALNHSSVWADPGGKSWQVPPTVLQL